MCNIIEKKTRVKWILKQKKKYSIPTLPFSLAWSGREGKASDFSFIAALFYFLLLTLGVLFSFIKHDSIFFSPRRCNCSVSPLFKLECATCICTFFLIFSSLSLCLGTVVKAWERRHRSITKDKPWLNHTIIDCIEYKREFLFSFIPFGLSSSRFFKTWNWLKWTLNW